MSLHPTVSLSEAFWFQEGPGLRNWQFTTSGIKVLNVGNIMLDGTIDLSRTDRHLSSEDYKAKYSHFSVDAGDLVIASSGISFDQDGFLRTKIAFIEESHLPLCMNTSTIRFKAVDGKSDLNYLRHWLQAQEFRQQVSRLVTGSAQLNFGPSHLKQMSISLPPLAEQKRIAAILDQADALRRLRRRALDRLNALGQAIFHEMFGDPVSNPRNLRSVELGEVCLFTSGGTPSKAEPGFWGGDIPWVSPKDMKRPEIISAQDHVTDEAVKRSALKLIPENTGLIVVRGMILAHTVPIAISRCSCTINQDMKALTFNSSILPDFGIACLQAQAASILQRVATAAHGTKRLDTSELSAIPIILPSIADQERFVLALSESRAHIEAATRAASSSTALFTSLQHRAFRGEL